MLPPKACGQLEPEAQAAANDVAELRSKGPADQGTAPFHAVSAAAASGSALLSEQPQLHRPQLPQRQLPRQKRPQQCNVTQQDDARLVLGACKGAAEGDLSGRQQVTRLHGPAPDKAATLGEGDAAGQQALLESLVAWVEEGRLPAHVWADPCSRCNLLRLLSCMVRPGCAPAVGIQSHEAELRAWLMRVKLLGAFQRSLVHLVNATHLPQSPMQTAAPAAAAVLRLLARTDVMPCLARTLAGAAASLAAVLTSAGAEGPPKEAAPGAASTAHEATVPASLSRSVIIRYCLFILRMTNALCRASLKVGDPTLTAAMRELRGSILSSRALEHATWAAVLNRAAGVSGCYGEKHDDGAGGASGAGAGTGINADGDGRCDVHSCCGGGGGSYVGGTGSAEMEPLETPAATTSEDEELADGLLTALSGGLALMLLTRLGGDRSVGVWVDALVSGRCVQYFLLLHVVSQLCTADGGPDYGLPLGARLLPEIEGDADDKGDASAAGGKGSRGKGIVLETDLMIQAFHWWADNRTRPCSDRALAALCARAAALAAPAEPSCGTGGTGGGSGLTPGKAVRLALAALRCALVLSRNRRGGGSAGTLSLWPQAVRVADTAVRIRLGDDLPRFTPLDLLVRLPLPALPDPVVPAAGGSEGAHLPSEPGPELSAALSADYVRALERTIRDEGRPGAAGHPDVQRSSVLDGVVQLARQNAAGFASLMTYGDPRQVAALIATAGMAVRRVQASVPGMSQLCFRGFLSGVADLQGCLMEAMMAWRRWADAGFLKHSKYWWRQYDFGTASSDRRSAMAIPVSRRAGASRPGGASVGGGGGGGDAGGDGSASASGSKPCGSGDPPRLPPLQQLSLLAAFATARWLPLVGDITDTCEQFRPSRMAAEASEITCAGITTIALWVQPLLVAYLDSRAAAAAASQCAGAVLPRSAAEADSWQALLLGPLDVPGLIKRSCQAILARSVSAVAGDYDAEGYLPVAAGYPQVLAALLHLLVALPDQGRSLLRTPVGTRLTFLAWIRRVACGSDAASGNSMLQHLEELAQKLEAGGNPSPGDAARLRACEGGWAARLAALLPPPCVVAAALQLRLCANPRCVNLDGDRGAGRVPGRGGDADGGKALYCSQACRKAHSRKAQQPELRARGGG